MAALPFIARLDDLRRALAEGAAPLPEVTMRLLLDTLALGNRETYAFLVGARPSQAEFEAWILATAGAPDPDLVSRYNAWTGVGEPSAAARAQLAAIDAMPDALGPDAIAQWVRDGYVVLKQAVPRAHAEGLATLVWDQLGARPDDPASWYAAETDGIMVGLYHHPLIRAARKAPRIHKAFAQLWGSADLWPVTDQLGFNPPERFGHAFRGSPLHWDVSLVRPIPFGTQGVLYLTDTATDQGAFRCVPGFHHRIEAWLDGLEGQDPRAVDLSAEAVCVPACAGDLVIWRQDLPHGASPNRAATPRLVQYLNFYSPDMVVQPVWR
jgi:hypothetical protein